MNKTKCQVWSASLISTRDGHADADIRIIFRMSQQYRAIKKVQIFTKERCGYPHYPTYVGYSMILSDNAEVDADIRIRMAIPSKKVCWLLPVDKFSILILADQYYSTSKEGQTAAVWIIFFLPSFLRPHSPTLCVFFKRTRLRPFFTFAFVPGLHMARSFHRPDIFLHRTQNHFSAH